MVLVVTSQFISSLVSPNHPNRVDDSWKPGEESEEEIDDEVCGAAGFDEDGEGWKDEGEDVEKYVRGAGGVRGVRVAQVRHNGCGGSQERVVWLS